MLDIECHAVTAIEPRHEHDMLFTVYRLLDDGRGRGVNLVAQDITNRGAVPALNHEPDDGLDRSWEFSLTPAAFCLQLPRTPRAIPAGAQVQAELHWTDGTRLH